MNPYWPLIKVAAIVAAVGLWSALCWHKGSAYTQGQWDADKAAQIVAAQELLAAQAKASNAVLTQREEKIRELESQNNAVRTIVHNVCVRDNRANRPVVSGDPATTQLPADTATDRAVYDPADDIIEARKVIADYTALRNWVLANGGDKP